MSANVFRTVSARSKFIALDEHVDFVSEEQSELKDSIRVFAKDFAENTYSGILARREVKRWRMHGIITEEQAEAMLAKLPIRGENDESE